MFEQFMLNVIALIIFLYILTFAYFYLFYVIIVCKSVEEPWKQ